MAKATVTTNSVYSITLSDLTERDIQTLRSYMQNSPHGYDPNEEPEDEWKLREAIHDACIEALNRKK